jgi:hypothetical protein
VQTSCIDAQDHTLCKESIKEGSQESASEKEEVIYAGLKNAEMLQPCRRRQ